MVDVTDFNGETWLDRVGNFNSDELHLVEHWNYWIATPSAIGPRSRIPKCTRGRGRIEVLLYRRLEPNVQIIENYCATLDYDQYYPVPSTK